MAEKNEMSEEYKIALEKKRAEIAQKKRNEIYREMQRRQSAAEMRREIEEKKRQGENERARAIIAECDSEIEKAQRILENKTYDTIAKISLIAILMIIFLTVGLMMAGFGRSTLLVMMILEFIILGVSVFFQSIPIFAEKKLHDCTKKLREAKNVLSKNKSRP